MSNILTNNINPRSGNLITIGGSNDKVSIAGTLTYEDVSNIDSVGIITAQSGLQVTGGNMTVGGTTVTDSNLLNIQGTSATSNIGVVLNDTNTSKIYGIQNGASALKVFDYTASAERMQIDSSGRVVIGVAGFSDDRERLVIKSPTGNGTFLTIEAPSDTGTSQLFFGDSDFNVGRLMYDHNDDSMSFFTNDTEQMRLDSSGNFGIGEASPTMPLMVKSERTGGKNIFDLNNQIANHYGGLRVTLGETDRECRLTATYGASMMTFYTSASTGAATERMRLDSAGRLLVGTTSTWDSSVGHQFRTVSGSSWALNVQSANGGSPSHLLIATGRNSAGDNMIRVETNHTALGGSSSTLRFKVAGDGTIFATNTSVQAASDSRLKENIRTSEDGLNIVNQLRPVRFDWKNDQNYGSGVDQLGFIAQEVEQVFPEAVGIAPTTTDFKGEDPKYKTVGPGAFIPVLVKALQEANAKIETLEQRLTDAGL
jgi:hypothetical protein